MKLARQDDRKKVPELEEYRTMTKEEVLNLASGEQCLFLLQHLRPSPLRSPDAAYRVGQIRINGKVRTWKKFPDRVEVPVKYGLYEYSTLDLEQAMCRLLIKVGP